MQQIENQFALACQIRANIRCYPALPYQEFISVFKGLRPLTEDLYCYFIGFFEECSPRLVKKFMLEQMIPREKILDTLNQLPPIGETQKFREAVKNGQF